MRDLRILVLLMTLFVMSPTGRAADAPPSASAMTSDQALQRLQEGNRRFVAGRMQHPTQDAKRRSEVSAGQRPFAAILSCADSRVPPELVFDQGLGDLFVVRVAGNTVDDAGLGSLEYGTSVLGAPLILVLGHSRCGAVEAALQGKPLPGHISSVAVPIEAPIKQNNCPIKKEALDCAIRANVDAVVRQLEDSQPVLKPLIQAGKLKVVGAVYDLATGMVKLEP
jgi:carbonic anhydrase